jgi:biopolymer transport protein ExbB
MKALAEFVTQGGPVMAAILLLSVVLYARVCKLLLSLRQARRQARERAAQLRAHPALLRRLRDGLQESFRQQRFALGAMVAAAPLLGLLGTVGGMSRTFDSLAQRSAADATGLARGISEVLVATESGLAVAIPALLLIAAAQRQMQKQVQQLDRLEQAALEVPPS